MRPRRSPAWLWLAQSVHAARRTTAELIVECLENEGVTHVFGIPGEENIRLVEALSRSSIEYVLTRHEQGASFMAEVYGRLTGRAGVCSATLGPGAINLLLGVADATTNSTPVLALSAQVGMVRSYKESHQSVDLVSMFAPVDEVVGARRDAGRGAGDGPQGVQARADRATGRGVPRGTRGRRGSRRPGGLQPAARQRAAARRSVGRSAGARCGDSASARNPILLAGHGAARSDASAAVRRFAEALDIPVATTFHGKGVMPDDHPLALGAVGFMRHDYVNFGFDQADVIVAAGYELQEFDPVRINPRGDTKIIHIHRFPAEVDAHYDVAVGLHADIGRSLDALAAAVDRDQPIRAGHERIRELLAGELDRGRADDSFPLAPARIVADTRDGTAVATTSSSSTPAH